MADKRKKSIDHLRGMLSRADLAPFDASSIRDVLSLYDEMYEKLYQLPSLRHYALSDIMDTVKCDGECKNEFQTRHPFDPDEVLSALGADEDQSDAQQVKADACDCGGKLNVIMVGKTIEDATKESVAR